MSLCLVSIEGCQTTNAMYLGDGSTQTVRLRKTIKKVPVWVKDSTGTSVSAVMDLPEGGYFRNNLK